MYTEIRRSTGRDFPDDFGLEEISEPDKDFFEAWRVMNMIALYELTRRGTASYFPTLGIFLRI